LGLRANIFFIEYIADYELSRYSSPIIPVRVGPHAETFPVHKDILTKSEYFKKALDGEFREAEDQAIDLPEEDPDIFSFVIAFLYEEKFVPIKPMAMALSEDFFFPLARRLLTAAKLPSQTRGRAERLKTSILAAKMELTVVEAQVMRGMLFHFPSPLSFSLVNN
jgi:BTB/POZ domain